MAEAVAITNLEKSAADLRRLMSKQKNGEAVRRLSALALILEGKSRMEVAAMSGMERQTLRDWVHRCLLVCDGAGWHQPGERLIVPDNITLLPLPPPQLFHRLAPAEPLAAPPYAPELNPMENVWDYLRGNKLSSLVRDSYEAMLEACKQAWLFLVNDPARIASIGKRDLGVSQRLR